MARKPRTKAGHKQYRKRKGIVEPPFGWIRNVLRIRSFSMRELARTTGECDLVCLAVNVRRRHGMITWDSPEDARRASAGVDSESPGPRPPPGRITR